MSPSWPTKLTGESRLLHSPLPSSGLDSPAPAVLSPDAPAKRVDPTSTTPTTSRLPQQCFQIVTVPNPSRAAGRGCVWTWGPATTLWVPAREFSICWWWRSAPNRQGTGVSPSFHCRIPNG